MMTAVWIVLAIVASAAILLVGLANAWSRTPHGRLKPVFALAFRVQALVDKEFADGVLGPPMETQEQRDAARAKFLSDVAPLSKPVAFPGTIEDRVLDGPGGPLAIRIYTPEGRGPFAGLLYLHGGGFVFGSPAYTDAVTRTVAMRAPAVVVSVDYRLAPEAPWPAAIEDCEHALDWCIENAAMLRIDPRAVAVGGDSAGGNLAAVLSQRDRDSGRKRIALQVLIYPTVDASRLDRASQIAFARGYGLSRRDIEVCFARYVQARTPLTDPSVSPLLAASMKELAPALVFTAGFDVLRDEGIEYAEALERAGVAVDHVHESAVPHGYITMTRVCREAGDSIDRIARAVGALATRRDP
jgi:acetyl esterase